VTQAVILAGGRGSRLAPITDSQPKPMVDVNGQPFLSHLVASLVEQGVTEILMLTGYLGHQIREYFGEGTSCGVPIRYSDGPDEWSTGERLLAAAESMDPMFLLLYGDNYVAFDLGELRERSLDQQVSLVLTICAKVPGNIVLNPNGKVSDYLRDRSSGNGTFVEVGFSLVDRDRLLRAVSDNQDSLPGAIEALTKAGQVSANVVIQPYFSVSDPDRLERTRAALGGRRILLLDRDGVINVKAPTGEYIPRFESFERIDSTWKALVALSQQGFSFIVISNQAGIARGLIRPDDLEDLHGQMLRDMRALGLNVLAIYVCPHHWDDKCECRKPLPGMFVRAAAEHNFILRHVVYVGDDPRDETAALAAGCACVMIGAEAELSRDAATGRFPDLSAAVPFIIGHYESQSDFTRSFSMESEQ
jgi:histidinol-phosphate phosphatase family protein